MTALCSLDIGDAFLQVDQVRLRRVAVKDMQLNFIIAKCLPGQRTAAKRAKQIVLDLVDSLGMEMCVENPSIFKGEHGCGITHVHDILVCVALAWLKEKFLPHLQSKYKISFAEELGDEVEFLKRKYRLTEQGLDAVPSAKHIAGLFIQLPSQSESVKTAMQISAELVPQHLQVSAKMSDRTHHACSSHSKL